MINRGDLLTVCRSVAFFAAMCVAYWLVVAILFGQEEVRIDDRWLKLHRTGLDGYVLIRPGAIHSIDSEPPTRNIVFPIKAKAVINYGKGQHAVTETPEEILKLIKESNNQ